MSRYWQYIPPQACDYSGAISLLYGMPTLILLLTPGGCIHPIVEADEERTMGEVLIYKSSLNEIDVTMGMYSSLIQGLNEVLEQHSDVEFITILGTPLIKITGLDMEQFAKNIEKKIGINVVFIETNGFDSYAVGYSKTLKKLIDIGSKKDRYRNNPIDYSDVGIIGYHPLIHGNMHHMEELTEWLSDNGVLSICIQGKSLLDLINNKFSTKLNIVISLEGITVARYLNEQYGIPYELDIPIGNIGAYRLGKLLENKNLLSFDNLEKVKTENKELFLDKNAIVIGEPFINEAVKRCLFHDFGIKDVKKYVIKPRSRGEMQFLEKYSDGVTFFNDELDLIESMNGTDIIIADPLYKNLIKKGGTTCFIPFPYGAVSGKLFLKTPFDYIGRKGFEYFNSYFNNLRRQENEE